MAKIKICGLKRAEDIEYVNRYKPDYIGFVFAKSKRQVSVEQAKHLKSLLSAEIKAVGVFVNGESSLIEELVHEKIIDVVQLHGDETDADIRFLRRYIDCPIIKAIQVKELWTVEQAAALPVDYLLLDAYTKNAYGGSGMTFDWSLLHDIEWKMPYFLAGGINVHNMEQALATCSPYCIDVSSGVETEGIKDEGKIEEIIKSIRKERK